MIGLEGFGEASGVDLDAAIGDHLEFQAAGTDLFEGASDDFRVAIALGPVDEDVDAGQFLLFRDLGFQIEVDSAALVFDRIELARLAAEPFDDGVGEGGGSDLVLAETFAVNVDGMDAVLEGAEPCVLDLLGVFRQADVDQHLRGGDEDARWIGDVLAGDVGS